MTPNPIPPDLAALVQTFTDSLVQHTADAGAVTELQARLASAQQTAAASATAFEGVKASLVAYAQSPPAPPIPLSQPATPEAVKAAVKVLQDHADAIVKPVPA